MESEAILERFKDKLRYAGAQNPVVKHVKKLTDNSKPNPRKLFVLEGIWGFGMAKAAGLEVINLVVAPECVYSPEGLQLLEYFCERAEDVNVVSRKVFMTMSERDDPDGLLAVCGLPKWRLSDVKRENALIVVLDGLEIPGNIGTVLRSCDAAAVDAVFVCDRKARLTHPKLVKGSMGALFFVPVVEFERVEDCREWLSANGFGVFLADTRAEKGFHEYDYKGNTALVVGSERYGINRAWYDGEVNLLSIPMLGKCDSLNVSIAATVVMYEMRLKKSGLRE